MARAILKAELAAQNTALRAELSQAKADLERALAHIQTLESERKAKPRTALQERVAAMAAEKGVKPLSRAELMAHAKKLAMQSGYVTQIRDGAVQVKIDGQWQNA